MQGRHERSRWKHNAKTACASLRRRATIAGVNLCYFCSYRYESSNLEHFLKPLEYGPHAIVDSAELHTRRSTLQTKVMGVQKKTRKFATVKRIIGQRDVRLKKNQLAQDAANQEEKKKKEEVIREVYVVYRQGCGMILTDMTVRRCLPTCSSSTTKLFNPRTRFWSIPTFSRILFITNWTS